LKKSKQISTNEVRINKYAERSKKDYLEQKKKIEENITFQPSISKITKQICKDRFTIEKSPDGQNKVKSILFSALYLDADERAKRQKYMEMEDM